MRTADVVLTLVADLAGTGWDTFLALVGAWSDPGDGCECTRFTFEGVRWLIRWKV